MENPATLKVKKIPFVVTKRILIHKGEVPPAVFILVKEFVDLHCNQINAIKGISFTSLYIAKGEE